MVDMKARFDDFMPTLVSHMEYGVGQVAVKTIKEGDNIAQQIRVPSQCSIGLRLGRPHETIYVLEGSMTLYLNDHVEQAKKGEIVLFQEKDQFAVKNESTDELVYLDCFGEMK